MAERRRKRNTDTIGSDDVSGSDVSLDGGRRKSLTDSDEEGRHSIYDSAQSLEELAGPAQSEEKKSLDDDEDRKNPQFIPKKGNFYEHDDRAGDEDGDRKVPEPKPTRRVWKEADRWQHDKFDESQQAPKSHEELVTMYGYDIRSEDLAPRARRRRRYGRGPNKYTRNWEDEEAYGKSGGGGRGGRVGRGGRRGGGSGPHRPPPTASKDEFPELGDAPPRRGSGGDGPPPRREHSDEPPRPRQPPPHREPPARREPVELAEPRRPGP
ncbi:protein CASC3-like, partial [Amphibalanus amphitrite]